MSRKFRVKFPGPKIVVIWYLGNVTWQAHFLNLWKFHSSCTFPGQVNMTFPAHFQWCQKFLISCTIPSKDTWNFLYISCSIRNFTCPTHFQDQGHVTLTVHFLYISCSIRNFTFHAHLQDTDTSHFLHISCDIRNFMYRVHFHCQGHVTFTVHFLST